MLWSRRDWLGATLGAGMTLLSRKAFSLGDAEKFRIAQVVYSGGAWQPRPSALRRLLWEIEKRTSIDVALEPIDLRLGDGALHRYPFLYLAGDQAFPPPSSRDLERLRRCLQAGGFLLIDGAEGRPGGGFDRAVRQFTALLFPSAPLVQLPQDHVVFKSFYLLHAPAGRVLALPYLEGINHDGRTVLVYCQNDLGGAWARDNFGAWEHAVTPGGETQRERAFRLGVNLAMYATCLDYKTDQVHVPFILRRRHWQSP